VHEVGLKAPTNNVRGAGGHGCKKDIGRHWIVLVPEAAWTHCWQKSTM